MREIVKTYIIVQWIFIVILIGLSFGCANKKEQLTNKNADKVVVVKPERKLKNIEHLGNVGRGWHAFQVYTFEYDSVVYVVASEHEIGLTLLDKKKK